MFFHEFSQDGILALDLGFELFDLSVLGLLFGLGLAAVVEGGVAVLEELLEPAVDLVGIDVEFVAQVGNRDLLEEVALQGSNLLLSGKMTAGTLLGHGKTSVRIMLTRTKRSSRFD